MTSSLLHPPAIADRLLALVIRSEMHESVSGDLLEEYRAVVGPRLGRRAADRWFWRQVCGFIVRAAALPGAVVGTILVVRYAADALIPTTDYVLRSRVMSNAILAVALLAGARAARVADRWMAGPLVAGTAGGIGGVVSIAGALVLLAIAHDQATLDEWRRSGGINEALVGVPLIITMVSVVLGTVGGLIGRAIPKAPRNAAPAPRPDRA